jgi:hypothetical protein
LFEHAMLEQENMPQESWRECWLPYIKASYEQSVEMRLFFEEHENFYVPKFRHLISNEIKPKLHSTESMLDNAPDLVRLAKDSRNNIRDCLMRLEVELMAL